MEVDYLQLRPGSQLPDITAFKPFLAVLVIEQLVSPEWRDQTSRWLVRSGCIYMMAWGQDCSEWETTVDLANIEQFEHGEIPEDELVMTSSHASDTLKDIFWQAKNSVAHSCVEFAHTLVLHISAENKEQEFLSLYSEI